MEPKQLAEVNEILKNDKDITTSLEYCKKNANIASEELIGEIISNFNNFLLLHNRLHNISNKIDVVENILINFAKNLGSMSSKMMHIQHQCATVSSELSNRKNVRTELVKFIDQVLVSDRMISVLTSHPVYEQEFIEQLHEFNYKLNQVEQLTKMTTSASTESVEFMKNLKIKCLSRSREYFVSLVNQLGSTNYNLITTRDSFIYSQYLMEFVKNHDSLMFDELLMMYMKIMKKVISEYHKTYYKKIFDKIKHESYSDYLIANNQKVNSQKENGFTMGHKCLIITADIEAEPIKIQENSNRTYSLEMVIRSAYVLAANNYEGEYLMLIEFFKLQPQLAENIVHNIFLFPLEILKTAVETVISDSNDAMSLLLSVSFLARYKAILQARKIAYFQEYFNSLIDYIWNRFRTVISEHIDSIRMISNPIPTKYNACHQISKRVSGLLSAFNSVMGDFEPNRIPVIFTELLREWECFTLLQASQFQLRRFQLAYQIINYNVVLSLMVAQNQLPIIVPNVNISVIHEASISLCGQIVADLRVKYNNMIRQISHEELFPFFGILIKNIRNKSLKIESNKESDVMSIAHNFANNWKNAIMIIAANLKDLFCGTYMEQEILEVTFSELIDYYKEFSNMMLTNYSDIMKEMTNKGKMVDLQQILIEFRKYR